MSKEITLKKADYDILQGNLGKACDRLNGLIHTYPDDLSLRVKIAEIYYQAKFLALAGKYWYLEENKTDIMKSACAEFEKSRGNNPLAILEDLKFRGSIDNLPKYVKEKLLSLQKECKGRYNFYHHKIKKAKKGKKKSWWKKILGEFAQLGCIIIIALSVILIIVGFVTIVKAIG